jgi:hypothetical protein
MCCLISAVVLMILVGRDLEFQAPTMQGRAYRKMKRLRITCGSPIFPGRCSASDTRERTAPSTTKMSRIRH